MRLLRLALAVPLLMAPAWAGAMVGGDVLLECGALAPFVNHCGDCCADYDGEAAMEANLFPYAGRFLVRLKDTDSSRALLWDCLAYGGNQVPLGGCTLNEVNGGPRRSDDVRLDCFAFPYPQVPPLVPPVGPYGCKVMVYEDDSFAR